MWVSIITRYNRAIAEGVCSGVASVPSVAAGVISLDNFQKDVRLIYNKLNGTYDPNTFFGTLGGELEKKVLGTDYVYNIIGIAANAEGGFSAAVNIYNKSGKVIDVFTIVVNETQDAIGIKDTYDKNNKK